MSAQNARLHCAALTQKGTPCKNYTLPNSKFCRLHQPKIAPTQNNTASSYATQRKQLIAELEALVDRMQTVTSKRPQPIGPVAQETTSALGKTLRVLAPRRKPRLLTRLQETVGEDFFDIDTWKGVWYMLNYTAEYQRDFLKRRITGDYETDEWGMDWEFTQNIRPFFDFLYKMYWHVETSGLENIPEDGRALLVGASSGQNPWNSAMVATAVATEHPAQRQVRTLYNTAYARLPFYAATFEKMGYALATVENGIRLLEQDELVAVYPSAAAEARSPTTINRLDTVRIALSTGAPMIPASIIGVEGSALVTKFSAETAPMAGVAALLTEAMNFFPIPAQFSIAFGRPISVDTYPPDTTENLKMMLELANQVRDAVDALQRVQLAQRIALTE